MHDEQVLQVISRLNLVLFPVGNLCRFPTNHPPPALPLNPTPNAHALVKDEPPEHIRPAPVVRQIAVELPRHLVQHRQPRPRHGREVVVLVVITDIVREHVERAVVAEGLGDGDAASRVARLGAHGLVDVVLGDEVAGQRVQGAGEGGGQQEVEQGVCPDVGDEDVVEGELDSDVDEVDAREGDGHDGHGADGVEEDLEGAEEGLAEDGVEEEGLEGGGEVRVEAVYAEGLVVGKMVGLLLQSTIRPVSFSVFLRGIGARR